jgi:hypothetical protein
MLEKSYSELIANLGRVIIIEPHSDDIALSCSKMARDCNVVAAVTVFANNSDMNSTKRYLEKLRGSEVNHYYEGLNGASWGDRLTSKHYAHGSDVLDSYEETACEKLAKHDDYLLSQVLYYCKKHEVDTIFVPVGITHLDHIYVSRLLGSQDFCPLIPKVRYVEHPYYSKPMGDRKVRNLVYEGLDQFALASSGDKMELFEKFYPTELGVLNSRSMKDIHIERYLL